MLRATMSSEPSCSSGMRSSAVMTICWSFALPKRLVATALAMSMSKPVICEVNGSRAPKRYVSAETPTTR